MSLQEMGKVMQHQEIASGFYLLTIEAPAIARLAQPGQFVHVKCTPTMDPLLRRPISLHRIDAKAGTITLLYQVVGRGTQLLSKFMVDDEIDLMGPLGRGFDLPSQPGDVMVVGGGIGAAPLLPLVEALCDMGNVVTMILGARSKDWLLGAESFVQAGAQVLVATDDGSQGQQGFVTDILVQHLQGTKPAALYACGPEPMLRAVASMALSQGLTGQVSLEERMGCGVGACLACVCKIKVATPNGWDYQKVCIDGPVFALEEVLWHE